MEGTTEESQEFVVTVPSPVIKSIRKNLLPELDQGDKTELYPNLPAVPEEMPLPEEGLEEDNPDIIPDSDEEPPAPEFRPTSQMLRDLKLAHDNSGHPTNADFARLLRRGNCRPDVAAWVRRNFKCDECEANKRPKARRPAAVPKTYRFNHVVGIDLVETKNTSGEKVWWLNCVCWGTQLQLVGLLGSDGRKTAENVYNCFVDTWMRMFGVPDIVICDPGLEFQGYFSEMLASQGAAQLQIDPRAPWQNGRTERLGHEWKKQFKIARHKEAPQSEA